jgi:hypothetical protein
LTTKNNFIKTGEELEWTLLQRYTNKLETHEKITLRKCQLKLQRYYFILIRMWYYQKNKETNNCWSLCRETGTLNFDGGDARWYNHHKNSTAVLKAQYRLTI